MRKHKLRPYRITPGRQVRYRAMQSRVRQPEVCDALRQFQDASGERTCRTRTSTVANWKTSITSISMQVNKASSEDGLDSYQSQLERMHSGVLRWASMCNCAPD